ncbi:transposase [Burkholderia plantarii]|nr:transposase [Burkholderia plantarii]
MDGDDVALLHVLTPGNKETKAGRRQMHVRDDSRSESTAPTAVWFAYSLNRWTALTPCCEDGRAEISNALAENASRSVSPRRKNFLFAGSSSGE